MRPRRSGAIRLLAPGFSIYHLMDLESTTEFFSARIVEDAPCQL
jgi:hypothetical protein